MTIKEIIKESLKEDIGTGDITTDYLELEAKEVRAVLIAKENGILAGIEIASQVFAEVDPSLGFKIIKNNGEAVFKGDILAEIKGDADSILTGERLALNFLQRMSGIATLTSKFVKKIGSNKAKLLDTRKTTPMLREFEKKAVKIGGGYNHRFGLYDMILIKENHIESVGNIQDTVSRIKKNNTSYKIEIEVTNLKELDEAVKAEVDRVMLDNMSLEEMSKAVEKFSGKVELEASGNVKLETVGEIAKTGVDYISCGSLTHSYKSLDISLLVKEL